jgi:hypothetical protein
MKPPDGSVREWRRSVPKMLLTVLGAATFVAVWLPPDPREAG